MSSASTVQELASLFRVSNSARPVLLLGAGASFSSGVPLAADSVRRLAKRVFADRVKGGSVLPEHVKLTEWQTWLRSHPWFIQGEERLAENFPLVVQHLLEPREYRAQLLLDLLQPCGDIGPGYRRLAEMVMRGLAHTILTTNLDPCLSMALNERRPHIRHIAEVNRGPDDLREFNIFRRCQIVWLHGRVEQYTDRNMLEEVDQLNPKLVALLSPLIDASPLVVIGYRGSEPSIMDCLLLKNRKRTHDFRCGIYWCTRTGEQIHPKVACLRDKIGGNFKLLEIEGFDELVERLAHELRGEDLYQGTSTPKAEEEQLSYDDRLPADAGLEELDHDLMLTVMRDYCTKLGRVPVTRDNLPALLREQGLAVERDGKLVPTNGCILLFGTNPQTRFPHAVVSTTVSGKKRLVFGGNLLRQREALLEWVDDPDVNPMLRVKRRTTHEDKAAYPPRALVELLVNMLVHRDYAAPGPAMVDIEPGATITFSNPGGLVDAVARRVTIDEDGWFRPVPNVSALRNPALCDVFFGIRAMEREGTGLSDVEVLAREHGGEATFQHNGSAAGHFVAQIRQPTASAGSTTVARHDRPVGVYVLNVLPFASIPTELSVHRLTMRLADRPAGVNLDRAGTFLLSGDELWSFAPASVLTEVLSPIIDAGSTTVRSRVELETQPESRRLLSWLLRKHFERYLWTFRSHGLIVTSAPSGPPVPGAAGRPFRRPLRSALQPGSRFSVLATVGRSPPQSFIPHPQATPSTGGPSGAQAVLSGHCS